MMGRVDRQGARPRFLWGMTLLVSMVVLATPPTAGAAPPVATEKSALETELELQAAALTEAVRASGRAAARTPAEAKTLVATLAAGGYTRLEDRSLLELLALRARLATVADEAFCAHLWTGGLPREMLPGLVLYLSDDEQRSWARLALAATLAVIRASPPAPPRPPESALEAALTRFVEGLEGVDGAFLFDALAGLARPRTADEQCRAARLYFGRLQQMPQPDRLLIFRDSLYE